MLYCSVLLQKETGTTWRVRVKKFHIAGLEPKWKVKHRGMSRSCSEDLLGLLQSEAVTLFSTQKQLLNGPMHMTPNSCIVSPWQKSRKSCVIYSMLFYLQERYSSGCTGLDLILRCYLVTSSIGQSLIHISP